MLACIDGDAEALTQLLGAEPPAGVTYADDLNRMPLHVACDEGGLNDEQKALKREQRKPLRHTDCVRLLLSAGAKTNYTDRLGYTPLHYACGRGNLAVVTLLLEAGCPLEAHCNSGETPLHWAANQGHEGIVAALLAKGARTDAKGHMLRTPLMYAKHEGVRAMLTTAAAAAAAGAAAAPGGA